MVQDVGRETALLCPHLYQGRVYEIVGFSRLLSVKPAPTGLLKMVQDVGRDTALLCPLCPHLYQLSLDSHAGRKHFRYPNNW
jgi:hypothetical protein